MTNDQLLEGVDIFVVLPQMAPMLIADQLRMDSSIRCGSESSRSDAKI